MLPDGIHVLSLTLYSFRFLVLRVSCAGVKAATARTDRKQAMALAADWQKLHRGLTIYDHTEK